MQIPYGTENMATSATVSFSIRVVAPDRWKFCLSCLDAEDYGDGNMAVGAVAIRTAQHRTPSGRNHTE
jgi:hypothetical protein